MPIEQLSIIYGVVFLTVLLFVEGAYLFYRDFKYRGERVANTRMRLKAKGMEPQVVMETLRRDTKKTAAWLVGPFEQLDKLVRDSGLLVKTPQVVMIMVLLTAAVIAALGFGTRTPFLLIIPFALFIGVAIPVFVIMKYKSYRLKKFAEQLPDALDIMVRSLRAGHPITAAIGLVAREMPDPAGTEFGILVDELTFGLELREALARMGERVDHPDLHFMIVSVTIQHGTGGNLAEVLSNLSSVIRDRFRLYKKVRRPCRRKESFPRWFLVRCLSACF